MSDSVFCASDMFFVVFSVLFYNIYQGYMLFRYKMHTNLTNIFFLMSSNCEGEVIQFYMASKNVYLMGEHSLLKLNSLQGQYS